MTTPEEDFKFAIAEVTRLFDAKKTRAIVLVYHVPLGPEDTDIDSHAVRVFVMAGGDPANFKLINEELAKVATGVHRMANGEPPPQQPKGDQN